MKIIILLVMLCLTGCHTTSHMWSDDYDMVRFTGYHVNEDKQEFTLKAKDRAYRFNLDEHLTQTLLLTQETSNINESINITPYSDHLSLELNINVNYVHLTEQEAIELIKLDYPLDGENNQLINKRLKGTEEDINHDLKYHDLQDEKSVKILDPDNPVEFAGKVIATPFTLAADTVIIAGAFVLFLPLMIMGH
ncbi:hypothetical protein RI844_19640 [Thalassotalea fonticola]|uniref:Lipoprotein n=1 Tax=Thalassotalea fonticola TaxID=3065649 RepID=A0ABZ0GP82_9GAMM|nr:hypothetical protein RI844_19640 [Colwelliaceae bacterium S1-1]